MGSGLAGKSSLETSFIRIGNLVVSLGQYAYAYGDPIDRWPLSYLCWSITQSKYNHVRIIHCTVIIVIHQLS